jgi:hypothetical protein
LLPIVTVDDGGRESDGCSEWRLEREKVLAEEEEE